jgi:hypothetical protein
VSFDRDERDILPEYRERLERLERQCSRVAAETGVLGTLFSLALVPLQGVAPILFVGGVVAAGGVYAYAYDVGRLVTSTPGPSRRRVGPPPTDGRLKKQIGRLRTGRVHLLVGERMAAADLAAAWRLWLALLCSHTRAPLESVTIAATACSDADLTVVLGGPLVRSDAVDAKPVCDLTARGDGRWRFAEETHDLLDADAHETAGCISTDEHNANLLFLSGARDAGTIAAVMYVTAALQDPSTVPATRYVMVHRAMPGKDGTTAVEVLAVG